MSIFEKLSSLLCARKTVLEAGDFCNTVPVSESPRPVNCVFVTYSLKQRDPSAFLAKRMIEELRHRYSVVHVLTTCSDSIRQDGCVQVHIVRVPKYPLLVSKLIFAFCVNSLLALRHRGKEWIRISSESFLISADVNIFHAFHAYYLRTIFHERLYLKVVKLGFLNTVIYYHTITVYLLHSILDRLSLNSSRVIISVSFEGTNCLSSLYGSAKLKDKRFVCLMNPLQPPFPSYTSLAESKRALRAEIRANMGLTDQDFVFVTTALGSWVNKGLLFVLQVLQRNPAAKLLVVGPEGQLKPLLRRFVSLKDRVFLSGYQAQVEPYLLASDCFLFPSYFESFSLATAQALKCGLPVVLGSFMTSGLFVKGNGVVCDQSVDSVDKAVRDILSLREEEMKRMQKASFELYRHLYKEYLMTWRSFAAVLK